jgi:type II secretory pathway component PulF
VNSPWDTLIGVGAIFAVAGAGVMFILSSRLLRRGNVSGEWARLPIVVFAWVIMGTSGACLLLCVVAALFQIVLGDWITAIVIFAVGVLMFVALACSHILYRSLPALDRPPEEDVPNVDRLTTVEVFGWLLLICGTLGLSLIFILGVFVFCDILKSRRIAREAELLWTLAVAVEQRLPLEPEVEAFAMAHSGVTRRRAQRLTELLREGCSLAAALDLSRGLLPRSAVLQIRTGEECGRLGPALRATAAQYTSQHQLGMDSFASRSFWMVYCTLFLVGVNILAFLGYYIVPKFKKIFEYFNQEMPDFTIAVLNVSDTGARFFVLWSIFPVTVIGLYLANSLRGWEWITVPLIGRFFPRLYGPLSLRCLGLAAEAGRPLGGVCETLVDGLPREDARARFEHVQSAIETGGSCWDALRREQVIRDRDAELLSVAERIGNLPWALRESADAIERRWRFRWESVRIFIQVAVVLFCGAVVMCFTVAFFLPLVDLLYKLGAEFP